MSALAKPARFAPDPRRRALLAKLHVAKKTLAMLDDDYRAVLLRVTGQASAADCTDGQIVAVLKEFEAKGFRATAKAAPGKPPRRNRRADSPMAGKARALWISLHQLGAVRDPSERALEAFAVRQMGCERMQWADQSRAYQLIEALKAMGTRAGWDQDVSGYPAEYRVHALRVRLCEAILAGLKRLGRAPRHWSIDEAAWQLCGVPRGLGAVGWETSQLDAICNSLGALLREAKGLRDEDLTQRGEQP